MAKKEWRCCRKSQNFEWRDVDLAETFQNDLPTAERPTIDNVSIDEENNESNDSSVDANVTVS